MAISEPEQITPSPAAIAPPPPRVAASPVVRAPLAPRRSLWAGALGKLVRTPGGAVGLGIVLAVLLITVLGPFLMPYPYDALVGRRFQPPSTETWLGTDELGRDVMTRLVFGGRPSLFVGLVAAAAAAVIGTTLGLIAGFKGGKIDNAIMRVIDVLLAFPALILILAIVAALGASVTSTVIAIAVVSTATFARVSRAPVLSLMEQEFVLAARVVGADGWRIVVRHLLANIVAPLIVLLTIAISHAILAEATLSFLGMGIQPPAPSWGQMLFSGRRFMEANPGLALYPGLAIMVTVLGFNLLGDALRDVLDPRMRNLN